jgi:hypothetical protein
VGDQDWSRAVTESGTGPDRSLASINIDINGPTTHACTETNVGSRVDPMEDGMHLWNVRVTGTADTNSYRNRNRFQCAMSNVQCSMTNIQDVDLGRHRTQEQQCNTSSMATQSLLQDDTN